MSLSAAAYGNSSSLLSVSMVVCLHVRLYTSLSHCLSFAVYHLTVYLSLFGPTNNPDHLLCLVGVCTPSGFLPPASSTALKSVCVEILEGTGIRCLPLM